MKVLVTSQFTLLEELINLTRLSGMQKQVLCKIAASSSGEQAADEISSGQNLIAARDVLVRAGLIEYNGKTADVTQKGFQTMKISNLIDDSNQLTDEGKKYVNGNDGNDSGQPPEDSSI